MLGRLPGSDLSSCSSRSLTRLETLASLGNLTLPVDLPLKLSSLVASLNGSFPKSIVYMIAPNDHASPAWLPPEIPDSTSGAVKSKAWEAESRSSETNNPPIFTFPSPDL
eukprot:CAMPEP_0184749616 /NCGR_PEP_ID=MMETSP0315-20130426/29487_1 /TAXON_ID=101924 /ORGANISM="Rhodosorus marinus, Strain UTEX LB 2760" /LENGTH=109 /DNA_ID=CAMNT_0027226821 /DNA_START=228 /DNA_END=557 /DNA_ORIENTATION=+